MNEPLTFESALSHSPDESSTKAARELAKPGKWKLLGAFDGDEGEVVWGEIKGSSGDYRTRVEIEKPTFDCSCPSRKRPCKHALALLALRAENPSVFAASPSSWVENDESLRTFNSQNEREKPAFKADQSPIVPLELPPGWDVLQSEIEKPYFEVLREFLTSQRAAFTVYPPSGQEWNALKATTLADMRVLILGQDPYHGPKQAHGMAFSVLPGIAPPPSLQNIFVELAADLGFSISKHGYLQSWAQQGVLLLNSVLTVRRGEANSHKNQGWEKFTDAVIRAVSAKNERVVFVLWGNYAQKKEKLIDAQKHTIIKAVHPSPLSAHNGFFGSRPFSQVNVALRDAERGAINWQLPTDAKIAD